MSEIPGLIVDILTANDKHSLCNGNSLLQPIQIQLSKKEKIFSGIFLVFSTSSWNFEQFEE